MPPPEDLMPELERTLYSGYVGQGPRVDEFEAELAAYLGNPHVLTTNSGTSALQLALRLAGVRGGSVVTTPMTCAATVLPVLAEGARVIWADIDPRTGNMDPVDAARRLAGDTRAILAVHWGGQPCDMDALMDLGQVTGVPVIIDAAHALGSSWDGEMTGGPYADFTCFSLQAIKHITTGDGGVLTMRSADDYRRGKILRWYGIDREAESGDARVDVDIAEPGYKFHMNDVTATIGLAQLKYLPGIVRAHRDNAAFYDEVLPATAGRTAVPALAQGAWWLYTLLWRDEAQRAAFQATMRAGGIGVSRVHARLDHLTVFKGAANGTLPGVDEFYGRECAIPVHWGLSGLDRGRVAAEVGAFCRMQP
ncbi:MAG TPA: DegT/DnrJ/EryC1/StrS family aminotransferase [Streptosporangiaceae bacterium]